MPQLIGRAAATKCYSGMESPLALEELERKSDRLQGENLSVYGQPVANEFPVDSKVWTAYLSEALLI